MKDKELIEKLRSNQKDVNIALEYLQKNMNTISNLKNDIRVGGGDSNDFNDVASEALYALYKSVREFKYREETTLASYFYTIAKNRWYTRVRKIKRIDIKENNDLPETMINDVDDYINDMERKSKANTILNKIGEDCKKIMTWYYYDGETVSKIAESLNINYQSVKNKLLNCRAKAKNI